jgi:hypothetical protein
MFESATIDYSKTICPLSGLKLMAIRQVKPMRMTMMTTTMKERVVRHYQSKFHSGPFRPLSRSEFRLI